MRQVLLGTALAAGIAALAFGPASAKTARECNAEYAANKAAIQDTQKKADFIAACRAGTEVLPGPAPTTVPTPAAPAPSPPAPTTASRPHPTTPGASISPNEFTTDAQAKAHCPGDTVVWVNARSHIYHFAGTHNYGNTNSGTYMCEQEAQAAGDRAPKNEKHP